MDAARRRERDTRQPGSGRHGGELLQSGLRVLWTLLYRGWGRAGACDPGLGQLAEAAAVARSTAQAAIDRLEAAGILLRIRRGLVVAGRWAQVTNAYLFQTLAAWRPASDTGSRPALESEAKPEAERLLWEGQGPAAPPDAAWLQEALSRYGLAEAV
jgi:DNA-binding transcriptional MocR family regulator